MTQMMRVNPPIRISVSMMLIEKKKNQKKEKNSRPNKRDFNKESKEIKIFSFSKIWFYQAFPKNRKLTNSPYQKRLKF